MRTTITIRLDESLKDDLEERARVAGTTVSQLVRDTLRDSLEEKPLSERIGHLRGVVDLAPSEDPWRSRMRERNWRR